MGLTAIAIKSAKGREKQYNGRFRWPLSADFPVGRAFGVWPETGLADARAKRDEARRLLAKGVDSTEQARLDKIAASIAAANTFSAIADEWLGKIEKDGLSEVTLKKIRWLLKQVRPLLGKRPIAEISAPELLLALRKIEAKGRHDTAQRLRSTCGQIFRYAIATARAERDVSVDLRGALIVHKVTHRAAILKPREVGALLRAIETFEGHTLTKTALRLLPHVFVRPGELRFAEWADLDLEKGVWTIPAHKTKMRKVHAVPLSRQEQSLPRSKRTRNSVPISFHRCAQPNARLLISAES